MVSAQRFRQAFTDQWHYDLDHRIQLLLDAYYHSNEGRWTAYMQTANDSFLVRLATRLQRSVRIEWYRLDAIYFDPANNPIPGLGKEYGHPARLEVYIEHENGMKPEEEMYKLLMWPASLKVLIFYDWAVFQKEGNRDRQQWLAKKLTTLFEMGREIDVQRPGVSKAEYLFLVGQTQQEGEPPTWQYLCVQDGCWPEQPSKPQSL